MALLSWALNQIIAQLDTGTRMTPDADRTITWGTPSNNKFYEFMDLGYGDDNREIYGLHQLNATQTAVAAQSLKLWSDVANIKFQFSGSTTVKPDITFQNSDTMGSSYALAWFPGPDNGTMQGSIWFNSNTAYKKYRELQNPSLTDIHEGGWSYMAFIHEIGHTLGLGHMGNYNGSASWPYHASCIEDSMLYSIMSYFTPEETGQADWRASDGSYYVCQTLMMNDIAAIQAIYGVNTTTRTTDTIYGFNASAGLDNVYNFNINKHPVLCLFDSGGIDTLDLSGFATSSNVNLLDGEFSSCDMMTKNISIARNVIIENATTGAGNDTISGNAANNILISNAGNDILNGLAGHDQLFGGAGNDFLFGGAGNDTLDGGTGNDSMTGGAGDDIYFIGSSSDSVVEITRGGNDTLISSTISLTLGQHIENAILEGELALNATGNASGNWLTGNNAANVLSSGAGNDSIFGGAGDDRLDGGSGADQLFGGAGNDTYLVDNTGDRITETGNGVDTVIASINLTLSANLENLSLTGRSAINAIGNANANIITGNANANTLNGEAGNDVLNGGLGRDTLVGGAGDDIFVFSTALSAANIDTIRDFNLGDDIIHLDSAIFSVLTLGTLQASAFSISTRALDADDRILYNARTGALSYDADGNGSIAAIQFATLGRNLFGLSATDFVII